VQPLYRAEATVVVAPGGLTCWVGASALPRPGRQEEEATKDFDNDFGDDTSVDPYEADPDFVRADVALTKSGASRH